MQPDILAIQEIFNKKRFEQLVSSKLKDYHLILSKCGGSTQQLLGFLYKKNTIAALEKKEILDFALGTTCIRGPRPYLLGSFKHIASNKIIKILNVHLKAGASDRSINVRSRQFQNISKIIKDNINHMDNFIILGDFNTVNFNPKNLTIENFNEFIFNNHLTDQSKNLNCSAYWWGGIDDDLEYSSMLDHLVTNSTFSNDFILLKTKILAHCAKFMCSSANSEDLGTSYKSVSDHCPIFSNFKY